MAYTTPIVTFGSITFTGADIKAATLVEECNPLTITLPINTFDVVIHSDLAAFSIINPTGEYALLQTKQPVTVYETTDAGNVLIGQYFLDKWENLSDTQIKLHCVDILGMLDVYTCRGGIWLTPIYATDLLKSILNPLGIAYQIDPYFDTFEITGWLPICTVRQALQQIAFAASAYVLTARQTGVIKFGRQLATGTISQGINCGVPHAGQSRVYQGRWRPAVWGGVAPIIYITTEEKGSTQSLTLRPLVTGVEITEHNYVSSTDTQKLYDGTLTSGLHTIYFSAPMHDLSVTGATITESGANYAIVNSAGGTVTLMGEVYVDTTKLAAEYMAGLPAGTVLNTLTITTTTLVNDTNGATVLSEVYDYYQKRYEQTVRLYAPTAAVGSEVEIDTLYSRSINGIVEKMSSDLAMGFTADADIVGTVVAL